MNHVTTERLLSVITIVVTRVSLIWLIHHKGAKMSIQQEASQDIDMNRAIEEWKKRSNGSPLVIAVVGKSGVGKSTLINNFLGLKGDNLCATGDGASTTTLKIATKKSKKQNITIHMIDTPGLGGINEISMVDVCKDLTREADQKIDVLIYSVSKHPSACIDTTDVGIIRTLTSILGPEIWFRTILALTYADAAALSIKREQDNTQIRGYATSLQKALDKAGVVNVTVQSESSKKDPSSIPVIPVGYSSLELPLSSNWINQLFVQVLEKSNPKTVHIPMSQAIKAAEFAGSVVAGVAIGAAVGTVIGAPFFGIGIIIGPVVGAVVGAAAGSILPVAAKVVQRRRYN